MAAFPQSDLDAARITAPTLVLQGEHVPAVLRDMHERLAGHPENADVELAAVPDAGHVSNLDNPEAFTRALRAFLASVTTEPT
ncbi:MAG: alpha/beta fold hydrolase [Halobacteriaceae archaeon]